MKKSSKNLVRTVICSALVLRFISGSSPKSTSPSMIRMKGSNPTARTRGSAS
jgi:hypothetical protein